MSVFSNGYRNVLYIAPCPDKIFFSILILLLARLHIVLGARLVMVTCFWHCRMSSSVTRRICNVTHHHHQIIYSALTTNVGRRCITMSNIKIVQIKIVKC